MKSCSARIILLLISVLSTNIAFAQNHYSRFESIDVQHYIFEIHLNDSTNRIEGKTTVAVKFLKPAENLVFDFIEQDSANIGMSVKSIISENVTLNFIHQENQLSIYLNQPVKANETLEFEIVYSGVPADGLVISKNKYGDRTFFGDNWPDRAKNWLPTVDHPSDKATLEFVVFAPNHYKVVSNGFLVKETELKNEIKLTHWKEDVPLSTKLMVIGAANFVIGNNETYNTIPISSWVFSENEKKGLENYKYGIKALDYFSEIIGPYSYEKLAHVQSKTRYGGMENASCIFYAEQTATSNNSQERLFAHEVAHQWFGNSVSEQNWHHVWLSEGFATYLTHVYNQHFYGEAFVNNALIKDRERVINYSNRKLAPIIDTTVTEYIELLNANSYQKASWFLHMLRNDLGDKLFFEGLRNYYAEFQNSTALTEDFKKVMETVSNKNLDQFFQQWLWQPGHPVLDWTWKQNPKNKLTLKINQVQPKYLFTFLLEIEIQYDNGEIEIQTIEMTGNVSLSLKLKSKVKNIILDPNVKLLFEKIQ